MNGSERLLLNEQAPGTIVHRKTAEVIIEEGELITQEIDRSARKRECRRPLHA